MHVDRRPLRRHASQPEQAKQEDREDGDVAAGDRDDVIRAGVLEPPFVVLREPGAVADQDCRRHASRPVAPRADGDRKAPARRRPERRGPFIEPPARRRHFDEGRALDGTDERDSTARQRPALVRNARVAVHGRPPKGCRQPQPPSGAPLMKRPTGECARDRQPNAARRDFAVYGLDVNRERDAGRGDGRVFAQDAGEADARTSGGPGAVEPALQRRRVGRRRRGRPQRHARARSADRHGCDGQRRVFVGDRRDRGEQGYQGGRGRRQTQPAGTAVVREETCGATNDKRYGEDGGRSAHGARSCKAGCGQKTAGSPLSRATGTQNLRPFRPFASRFPRGTPAAPERSAPRYEGREWR